MLLKKHVRSICYLNNMCFSHANEHMSILYVGCRKFFINRFVEIFCPFIQLSKFSFYFFFLRPKEDLIYFYFFNLDV
jgi:hypothetical protein